MSTLLDLPSEIHHGIVYSLPADALRMLTMTCTYFHGFEVPPHSGISGQHLNHYVGYGNLDLVRFASDLGYPWNIDSFNISAASSAGDSIAVIDWLRMQSGRLRAMGVCAPDWSVQTTAMAATHNLRLLTYLHEHGCPWNWTAWKKAHSTEVLEYLRRESCEWDSAVTKYVARKGRLDLIQYFEQHGYQLHADTGLCALSCGHIAIFEHLYPDKNRWTEKDMWTAAGCGKVEVVKYLRDRGCSWDLHVFKHAVRRNHINVVKYLYDNGCHPGKQTVVDVVRVGNLEMLQYIIRWAPAYSMTAAVTMAVKYGHYDIMLWLIGTHTYQVDGREIYMDLTHGMRTCNIPGRSNQHDRIDRSTQYMQILKYLCAHDPNHHYLDNTIDTVVKSGCRDMVKYLYELGCAWTPHTFDMALKSGNIWMVAYLIETGCSRTVNIEAAIEGGKDTFAYLWIKGGIRDHQLALGDQCRQGVVPLSAHLNPDVNWYSVYCQTAIRYRRLDVLQYLASAECISVFGRYCEASWHKLSDVLCGKAVEHACQRILQYLWDCGVRSGISCVKVAKYGNWSLLPWLAVHGHPDPELAFSQAVETGRLKLIEWLHTRGCPWDVRSCASAAKSSTLRILRYLHDRGCPWDDQTSSTAVGRGDIPMLEYLYQVQPVGCPAELVTPLWTPRLYDIALQNRRIKACNWLFEHNCPQDGMDVSH